MLRFPSPLTAAATALFVYCLEVSSDELIDAYESDEDFGQEYLPVSYTHLTLPTILRV